MCGIVGFVYTADSQSPGRESLERMVGALRHRGPDGNGILEMPGVGLGHARLSIIDIDGGAQPMTILNGKIAITFNGEIYNYKELRAELERRGHRFVSQSDTEVILRMYEEYGEKCLTHMNGMFAFAIWDERDRSLLVARDRMGEKPLYYTSTGGRLAFGSELKALRECSGVSFTTCESALDDYLAYGYVPEPRSIFKEVKKLEPAGFAVWKDGHLRVGSYWNTDSCVRSESSQDVLEQFEELLLDSMRIRLRSDVPVGAFLSGGIDSTIIAWAACKEYPEQLSTYTIGFEEGSHDESADAEFTAKFLGTRHTTRRVDGVSLDILPKLVRQYDEPFADPSAVPTYYVTREASRDLKVCLSGDGGDELFGGYPQYLWEPFERGFGALPRVVRRAFLKVPVALLPMHAKGHGWLQRLMADGAVRYQQKIGVFSSSERHALFRESYSSIVDDDAHILKEYFNTTSDPMQSRQLADRNTYLPGDILAKVDRSSMAHSLEVRTPFLDHRIVEFAHTLPQHWKIANGEQKVLLRQFIRKHVPAEILNRGKKGFGLPLRDWFRGEYREFVGDRLLSRDSKLFDYLDVNTVRNIVHAHDKGVRDFSDRIWTLIWLDEWFRSVA